MPSHDSPPSTPPSEGAPLHFKNHLLNTLEADGRERFLQRMKRVEIAAQEILYHPDQHITHIYFPEGAVVVMQTVMENGATIEAVTVGLEGASWISASFNSPTMPCQTIVAIGGAAYRVPTEVVETEIKRNQAFHNVLSHYAHALLIQAMRSGSCNGLHHLKQRCARWMLTTLDRTRTDDFWITQEFLASLLGVRRTGINDLVEEFVAMGVIENNRGHIRVIDRQKLGTLACECYGIIRAEFFNFTNKRRAGS